MGYKKRERVYCAKSRKDVRSILAMKKENYVLPAGPDGKRSGKA